MQRGRIKSSIEGLRFAKFPLFLKEIAWNMDLALEIQTEKGWIRETVFFELKGPEDKLRKAMKIIDEGVKEYNSA